MYVCVCQMVTDEDIREAAADGVASFAELQACTGCSTGCGCCESEARKQFAEARTMVISGGVIKPDLVAA